MTVRDEIALGIGYAIIKFINRQHRYSQIQELGVESVFEDAEDLIDAAATEAVDGIRTYTNFQAEITGTGMKRTSPCLLCFNKEYRDDDSMDCDCRLGHNMSIASIEERVDSGCPDLDKDDDLFASLQSVDEQHLERWLNINIQDLVSKLCLKLTKAVALLKDRNQNQNHNKK